MYKLYPESRFELKDANVINNYIHGGKGILTLEAPSGKSHTYLFSKPRDREGFPDDVIFVYALHNEPKDGVDIYKQFYIGMIEGNHFRLTRHSRFLPDTEIVKGATYIVKMSTVLNFNKRMKLYHEGMCAFCGRQLTQDASKELGMGPRCKKRIEKKE